MVTITPTTSAPSKGCRRFGNKDGSLLLEVPRVIEEGVDPSASIQRTGAPTNETLSVLAGKPLRIQDASNQPQKQVELRIDGTRNIILLFHSDDAKPRLVYTAAITVNATIPDGNPPMTVTSVAGELCVRRTLAQFITAAIKEANNVLLAALAFLTATGAGGTVVLLGLGKQAAAIIPAVVLLVIAGGLCLWITMSWVLGYKEVRRWRTM
jgi:hypothetical protein